MKHLLSLLVGVFTFLFPSHQAPVSVQAVATTTASTTITTQVETPVKPVSQAKSQPSMATAPAAPIVVPAIPAPIVVPVVAPVAPEKNPITVPPVLPKPHPEASVSINQVKIKQLQDQYDVDTANIKKVEAYVSTACQPLLTASPIVQGNAAIALQASAAECQSAEDGSKLQLSIYQQDQSAIQQQITALQNDPIQ